MAKIYDVVIYPFQSGLGCGEITKIDGIKITIMPDFGGSFDSQVFVSTGILKISSMKDFRDSKKRTPVIGKQAACFASKKAVHFGIITNITKGQKTRVEITNNKKKKNRK